MKIKIELKDVYAPSDDIVARLVAGEFVIIPITSGIGDMEDELYTLNDTGKAIWDKLDGKKTLKKITEELSSEFQSETSVVQKDCLGLLEELLQRKMIVEIRKS
jgi:hypothetical protein